MSIPDAHHFIDPSEPRGDIGDQAQALQMRAEQEAIEASVARRAGHEGLPDRVTEPQDGEGFASDLDLDDQVGSDDDTGDVDDASDDPWHAGGAGSDGSIPG